MSPRVQLLFVRGTEGRRVAGSDSQRSLRHLRSYRARARSRGRILARTQPVGDRVNVSPTSAVNVGFGPSLITAAG